MNVFTTLGFILCIASSCVADIAVQTSRGHPVSLSKLGIEIHEVTDFRFTLRTCTYGYISLKNTNSTSADLQVVFNYPYNGFKYTAISKTCKNACGDDSTTLDYVFTDLSLCQEDVELWTSWNNGSLKAGTIKKGSKQTLVSTFEVIPIADVLLGTNSSINDTWILHGDVLATTTTTTTAVATTITTTAATTTAAATTELPTTHTLPWTKGGNSTSTDINREDASEEILGILFKSGSSTLGSLCLVIMILFMVAVTSFE